MKEKMPAVDVIIVNYNGMQYLPACLDSLFKTDYPSFSVILVDNASHDGSSQWVRKHYPQINIIDNNRNVGFGTANNIGINLSRAPFVALLNSDTIVSEGWLGSLVHAMLAGPDVAAACSKLLFMQNSEVLNSIGGGMNFTGYGYDIGIFDIDDPALRGCREVFFPCAAACVLKRSAFDDIGGFDERFFMYHEDVDLGWRLRLKGYRIQCVLDSVVYHAFGGTSSKSGSMSFRNRLGQRHALRSLLKNYEYKTLLRVLPLFFALGIRAALRERSLDFVKCLLWNLKYLPETLRERAAIQRGRTIDDKTLQAFIWQKLSVPVQFPDYTLTNRERFLKSESRQTAINMRESDCSRLGYGWHCREVYFGDHKTVYRWTRNKAVVYLWKAGGDAVISMDVLGLAATLNQERSFAVSVNGGKPHRFKIKSDEWETITVPCPETADGPLEIGIEVEKTWCPDIRMHNGDQRELGIGVKKVALIPSHAGNTSWSGLSVVIPTYNRIAKLLKVLAALETQTLDAAFFEIIVVDDGSTDETEEKVRRFMRHTRLNIKYFKQRNKKQGAARNLGIKHVEKPLVVFIGDDIVPESRFLEEHLNYHRQCNHDGNTGVIGYTTWPRDMRVTPFMKYIGEYGHQFGYALIHSEEPVPFNFFYTSNISIPKALLESLEYIFEEDFDTYGWEDIELGYRLEREGMRLFYHPSAVAYHDHPVDIADFTRRQLNVGRSSRTFLQKHPELEWFLGNDGYLQRVASLSAGLNILAKVMNSIDQKFCIPLPHIFYKIILDANYAKGAR